MLAVLIGFLKGWTRTTRRDAFPAEPNRNGVRIRIRTLNLAVGNCGFDYDFLYDLALFVVKTTKECSSTEKSSQSSVGQCGEGVSKG